MIEVTLGTFPHGGATQRLPRLIGLANAKELVLAGEYVEPGEAEAIGLVNEIASEEDVDDRARRLADHRAENAPRGMANAERAVNAAILAERPSRTTGTGRSRQRWQSGPQRSQMTTRSPI